MTDMGDLTEDSEATGPSAPRPIITLRTDPQTIAFGHEATYFFPVDHLDARTPRRLTEARPVGEPQ